MGKDDKRRVARRELLVKLHLRAKLVCGREEPPVGKPHSKPLGAELDEPVELQSRIVGLDYLGADGPNPVVRKALRPRHEEESGAADRENDDGNEFFHS